MQDNKIPNRLTGVSRTKVDERLLNTSADNAHNVRSRFVYITYKKTPIKNIVKISFTV